jgi:DNA-binding CsgD family transcriptional regulator
VLSKYRSDRAGKKSLPSEKTPLATLADLATATKAAGVAELPSRPSVLSPREQEVLALIARGFSYTEIARLQALSVHTVQSHIKNLYTKLSVHSKSEAVFEATRMGLLPLHG